MTSLSGRVEVAQPCSKDLNSINIFLKTRPCNRPHGRDCRAVEEAFTYDEDNRSAYKALQYKTEGCDVCFKSDTKEGKRTDEEYRHGKGFLKVENFRSIFE